MHKPAACLYISHQKVQQNKKGHGIELLVPRRVRKIIEQQKGYGATTPIGFNQRG